MMKQQVMSFKYALAGISEALGTQRNFRIHSVAVILVVVAGWILDVDRTEWLFLVFAMGLVMTVELINTAIEFAVDLATQEVHPLAKSAKDIAAGAVLLASLTALVVGLLVLGPKILAVVS